MYKRQALNDDIFGDIQNGTLPQVSWVEPTLYHSDHPPGNLKVGQVWVARVVDALMASPYWNSTAIFLTWDEYGGFYDHVAPPHTSNFTEGFRVPLIIISPYAKQGYVDHTQYDGFRLGNR